MKFLIDQKIFEKFPSLTVGVVVAKGIQNTGKNPEILASNEKETARIKKEHTLGSLSQNPKLTAWREAYRSFGAKPKKYHCSVENLYRMILEGMPLRHINSLVDIYSFISIKHMIPTGGDDLDKVEGDIVLKFAHGDEPFVQFNASEVDHPKPGEVVYMDDKEVLCRRWNWRECEKSKMTEETKNALLVVEGLPLVSENEVQNIIEELGESIKKFCGGTCATHLLNAEKREVTI